MANAYEIISRFDPDFPRKRVGQLLTDTSEFMNITYGDVGFFSAACPPRSLIWPRTAPSG